MLLWQLASGESNRLFLCCWCTESGTDGETSRRGDPASGALLIVTGLGSAALGSVFPSGSAWPLLWLGADFVLVAGA